MGPQLLVSVDAGLLRTPGPLLCQCAEVLAAGCSPRPLRLAVVCLLATFLARKDTARALLLFPSSGGQPQYILAQPVCKPKVRIIIMARLLLVTKYLGGYGFSPFHAVRCR